MYNILLNRWNIQNTRDYLMQEFGIGMNLPVWHYEQQSIRGLPKYKFLIVTFTWNTRGLFVIEGEYSVDKKGIATIVNAGILTVWQSLTTGWDKKFKFNWLCDNSETLRDLIKNHYL